MATCPNRNYTYISTSNFGDKKKVTEELLRSFCNNDAYFKRKTDELEDLTDPQTRKRFVPPYFLDQQRSFGVISGTRDGKPIYKFNSSTSKNKVIDFNTNNDDGALYDDSLIDYASSNVEMYNDGTNSGARIKLNKGTKIVPVVTQVVHQNEVVFDAVLDCWDRGSRGGILAVEDHWYVGFRKNINYHMTPQWQANPFDYSIPACARAQSFKADHTGIISHVNVAMAANEVTTGDIYLEIRPMTADNKPSTDIIARSTAHFSGNGPSGVMLWTFYFDNAARVTAGQKYALVFRSSLGKYSQTYHLCGWDRRVKGEVYDRHNNGYAYVSYDNGLTWWQHTHDTSKQLGLKHADTPLAFGFEVFVKETRLVTTTEEKTEYHTEEYTYYPEGTHNVYFKVPVDNPIESLTLAGSTTTPTGTDVKFYLSRDNRNWKQNGQSSGEGLYDETTCADIFGSDNKPTFLFIRADLSTTDIRETPILKDLTLTMNLIPTKKAYLRTLPYKPDRDVMLPASIWSEADITYENNYADVNIDVIHEKEQEEMFLLKTATVKNLQSLILEYDDTSYISDLNTDAKIKTYCTENPDFVEYLKTLNNPIYILGLNDNSEPFFENFELHDYAAYPMVSVQAVSEDMQESDGDNERWSYADGLAIYHPEVNLKDQLMEVNLTRHTNNSTENIILFSGTIGSKVDRDESRYADFNYDTTNNLLKFDITNNSLFKEYAVIDDNKIVGFRDPEDATKIYDLNICGLNTNYTEWLDYTIDYDNKIITWEENGLSLVEGMLRLTYNPIFVRDLTSENFPLKLDLWTEEVTVLEDILEYELKAYPIDSLRLVALAYNTEDEVVLLENTDFTVDYQNKTIHFNNTIETGAVITIKYTPALTDNALCLGVRMDRDTTEKDCYIYGNSFTTRT